MDETKAESDYKMINIPLGKFWDSLFKALINGLHRALMIGLVFAGIAAGLMFGAGNSFGRSLAWFVATYFMYLGVVFGLYILMAWRDERKALDK